MNESLIDRIRRKLFDYKVLFFYIRTFYKTIYYVELISKDYKGPRWGLQSHYYDGVEYLSLRFYFIALHLAPLDNPLEPLWLMEEDMKELREALDESVQDNLALSLTSPNPLIREAAERVVKKNETNV